MVRQFRRVWAGEWSRSKIGYAQHDISAPDDFPYAIEVKNHDDVTCRHFLHPTAKLDGFWKQTKEQAAKVHKEPLMCINADRDWYAVVIDGSTIATIPHAITLLGDDTVVVLPLTSFLENIGDMHETN